MNEQQPTAPSVEYHTLAALIQLGGVEYPENLLRYAGIPAPEPQIEAALRRLDTAGLIGWDDRTGSWRIADHAAAVLAAVDTAVMAILAQRAIRDPDLWDSNVADPADLAERAALLRDDAWGAELLPRTKNGGHPDDAA